MIKHLLAALAAFAALTLSCAFGQTGSQSMDPLASHIDSSVKPGDDFFLYANGRWFKQHPIPASETDNGLWRLIQDTINAQILNLCESSAALTNASKGSNKQKIGDFYYTGMDSVSLNNRGLEDLEPTFKAIDGITDLKGVVHEAAYIHAVAGSPLFSFGIGQDDKISSKNAIFIWQGGLSLPDRRFYFDADSAAIRIREKFVQHLERTFELMGYAESSAQAAAQNEMKLETALAKSARKREDTRDPFKNYNKMSFKQLTESTP
jgi:putative endopeptidase